jgi:hypothetical protein
MAETDRTLTDADHDALRRAYDTARKNPAQRQRLDEWLASGRSWEAVAISAACLCQTAALDLKPWMVPPCSATILNHLDDMLLEPYNGSGNREAAEIVRRLRSLGLSDYEPDPARAIERAERLQVAK